MAMSWRPNGYFSKVYIENYAFLKRFTFKVPDSIDPKHSIIKGLHCTLSLLDETLNQGPVSE